MGFLDGDLGSLDTVPVIQALLGIALVFSLPGLAWTLAVFKKSCLSWLERMVISSALSIVLTTLTVFVLNWVWDVPITSTNLILVIFGLIIIPLVWLYVKKR